MDWHWESGPRFNIKMSSYQYRKSHCGDKRSSYLHNRISYTGKISSLYWIRALDIWLYNHWKSELSWCLLCCHWRRWRLSLWQPLVPPVTTKWASWRLSETCITHYDCDNINPILRLKLSASDFPIMHLLQNNDVTWASSHLNYRHRQALFNSCNALHYWLFVGVNPPMDSPHKGPKMQKTSPCHDIVMVMLHGEGVILAKPHNTSINKIPYM